MKLQCVVVYVNVIVCVPSLLHLNWGKMALIGRHNQKNHRTLVQLLLIVIFFNTIDGTKMIAKKGFYCKAKTRV